MEKVIKPTFNLAIARLWERERLLLMMTVTVIVVGILYNLMSADLIFSIFNNVVYVLQKTKNVINDVIISLFTGFVVYLLTIVLPETRKCKPILKEIDYLLKDFVDAFTELKIEEIGIRVDASKEENINRATELVKLYGGYTGGYYSLHFCAPTLRKLYGTIDEITTLVLNNSVALTKEEVGFLVDVRNKKITRCLKYQYGVYNLLTEDEIRKFFEQLLQMEEDIKNFHFSFKKRIYK